MSPAGEDPAALSSSGSLERLRLLPPVTPRFAEDMLGRKGELLRSQWQFGRKGGLDNAM
jgi:hypothetical protein